MHDTPDSCRDRSVHFFGSRAEVADGHRTEALTGKATPTVLKSMLHFAMHASPPVPGAMTSGYFLNSVKVDSGMPVAALSTELGICISEAQMVCVPALSATATVSDHGMMQNRVAQEHAQTS